MTSPKIIDNSIIESFVNCKYKAYIRLNNESGNKTEFELLQNDLLELYKKKFYNTNRILQDFKFEEKQSIKENVLAIEPYLKTKELNIGFDAIEIIPVKHGSKKLHYVPVLISPKEKVTKIEKLILCLKCVVLFNVYSIDCDFGKIIYSDNLKTIKFKIDDYRMESRRLFDELNKITKTGYEPLLFHNKHCKICEFQSRCHSVLLEKDDISLLSSVNEKDISKYERKGIFTIKQLSYTFRPRKRNVRVKNKCHLFYESLQALAIREQKVYIYDLIDLPNAKTNVFIDMEGNSDGSFIYLIGVLIISEGKEEKHAFWADSTDEENSIFREFCRLLIQFEDPHIFFFGNYESKVIMRLLKTYQNNKVKGIINNKACNVLSVIYSNIYFPVYSNSLKEIGKYLGCNWSHLTNAIESIVIRHKWEKNKDSNLKEDLIEYNLNDVVALKKITDFIYSIFNKIKYGGELVDVNIVKKLELQNYEGPNYKQLNYFNEDIKIITKCSYYEYQRNKIYLRTNKKIRRAVRKRNKKLKCIINKKRNFVALHCPTCKNKSITKKNKPIIKICMDLKFSRQGIRGETIKYVSFFYSCPVCKAKFLPKSFKKIHSYSKRRSINGGNKKRSIYYNQKGWGHSLLAWTIDQLVVNKNSLNSVARNFKEYFRLSITFHDIGDMKIIAANFYKKTYKSILDKIVYGNLIHADETKVKLSRENGYVWVFTNLEEVYYLYKPTREASFLHGLLSKFNGVLISDFYSGYDSLNCKQQKCLAHLIRDLNNTLQKNPIDDELKEIVINFGCLLRKIIETVDRYGLKTRFMKKHKKDVKKFFRWLEKQTYDSYCAELFKKRMINYKDKLFLFLDYNDIPWNNNNAENAIKQFAHYRRNVNGQIGMSGVEAHLILLSIYQTCKYKGINFLDFLLSKEKDIDKFAESCSKKRK